MVHHPFCSRARRASATLLIVAIITLAPVQAAIAEKLKFDIPAQSAASALRMYGQQTGKNLLFSQDAVDGVLTRSVIGQFESDDALLLLLRDTGLRAVEQDGVIAVKRVSAREGGTAVEGNAVRQRSWFDRFRVAQAETASENSSAESESASTESKAAPALEEIVVTAEKRAESVQSLPIAISAFSQEALVNRGISDLESLRFAAPSLQVGYRYGGYQVVTIRGISNQGGPESDAVAAVSQDGVAFSSMYLLNLDFFDIERVEVLRGPQGTIGGRNATAGAINVISNRPTNDFEGSFKTTIGNYNRIASEGYLSGPILGSRLLGRLAVQTDRADGWVTNTLRDEKLGSVDKIQARASFLAPVGDNFEGTLILEGRKDRAKQLYVDNGRARADVPSLPEFYGLPAFDRDRRTLAQDEENRIEIERYQSTLKLDWDLGASANLTATTGYVSSNILALHDLNDATALPLFVWDRTNPPVYYISQFSQEATLTADLADRLDMIVGALYLQADQKLDVGAGIPPLGIPCCVIQGGTTWKLNSWAGYTQFRYGLTDTVRLTAGVRYTNDEKDVIYRYPPSSISPRDSWSAWTPRFSVDYMPSDDMTVYATASRGYKAGGINYPSNNYEPENVWNYELGLKASLLDNRVSASLAGFYMDYTNLQQVIYRAGVGDEPPVLSDTINAKAATIKGIEAELEAQLTDAFRLTASGTYLDAKYDELLSQDRLYPELGTPGPTGVNLRNVAGNQLVRTPKWQFNVTGEYRASVGKELQGVFRAAYAWQDRVYFDFFNNPLVSQGAYGILNVSAGLENSDGRWQLTAFVNNVTDKIYCTNQALLFDLAPVQYSVGMVNTPRMYGLSLGIHF